MTSSDLPVRADTAPVAVKRRPGWLARAWAGLRFRDAVVITAIPLLLGALLVGFAVLDYARARQFDDWWSNAQTVNGYFYARLGAIKQMPEAFTLRHRLDPDVRDAGVIRLEVPGASWDSITGDPLTMWGTWVDGTLRYGRTMIPVKLRKRGDNSIHWLTDKRSLTVRTPREEFYKRFRSFGLSGKDVLPSYLANRMASEFGVLAAETQVVPVYLNNRFYGMYRFVELPDESFLRPFNRMPGNIFRADAAERGEYYKGSQRVVFENPYIWDRSAANDRWTSAGSGQLQLLLGDIAGSTFADHQRLMGRVDREAWARLFAYLLVMGDPYHMDRVHNQFIYEDPSTQLLYPIPWDIRLLDLNRRGWPLNNWFQAMLRDPFVVDATIREVAARVRDDATLALAESLATGAESRYRDGFRYDRLRRGLVPDVGEASQAVAIIRGNVALLRRWVDSASFRVAVAPHGGGAVLDLESRGYAGADLVALTATGPIGRAPRLRLDSDLDGLPGPGDRVVPLTVRREGAVTRLVPAQPVPLYSAVTSGLGVAPGRMSYRIFVEGAGPAVTPELQNRATGNEVTPRPLEQGTSLPPDDGWHPWRFPRPVSRLHRFSGTVRIDETLRIPASDTVEIAAGTEFRLGPDVSLVIRGLVRAEGTAARPIRVVPAVAGRPWGAFTLLGNGADRSVLRHVEFAEGGGALVDRIEYIGMVNVHHVHDVRFEAVTFRDNRRSDDTFHALHSRVVVEGSHFLRANSDALDMDVSEGELIGNTFEASGGDAIDLMASTPRIIGNRISGSGDKGISIGEASAPFVFDNLVDGCAIGIEVKDRSTPVLLHNELVRNGTGLRERRKNWRYGGGGWATIARTRFAGNHRPWVQDPFSRATLAGVVGLDSLGRDSTDAAGLEWLYAAAGVWPEGERAAGRLSSWRPTRALPAIEEVRFVDDFGPVSDGWVPAGGLFRLEKRRDALILEAERNPGTASLAVDWALPDGGTLVLEAAGEALAGARVTVRGDGAPVTARLDAGAGLHHSRLTEVRLAPGRYREISLEIAPVPGLTRIEPTTGLRVLVPARVDLRRYAVYPPLPEGGS